MVSRVGDFHDLHLRTKRFCDSCRSGALLRYDGVSSKSHRRVTSDEGSSESEVRWFSFVITARADRTSTLLFILLRRLIELLIGHCRLKAASVYSTSITNKVGESAEDGPTSVASEGFESAEVLQTSASCAFDSWAYELTTSTTSAPTRCQEKTTACFRACTI